MNTTIPTENMTRDLSEFSLVFEKLLHWAAIIESTDDAVVGKSIDGFITSWNPGAARLFGYTAEEIIGKPVSVLMPPNKKNDFKKIMSLLKQGKKVEHYETQRQTKDGRIIEVSLTVSPLKNQHGKIIGASKIARDITHQKELENRRDDFISMAAHELKTPLTSIKAFNQLLERQYQQEGKKNELRYVHKMGSQIDKLMLLISDLLDASKVQQGKLEYTDERFKLHELIENVVEDVQQTVDSHTMFIENNEQVELRGDKGRIEQVLSNLLNNAVKYSPFADKIIVRSTINNDHVVVEVQDFGIGIDAKDQARIFDRFYRATSSNEKVFPGLGIGLYICQEIIRRHHGKLMVESTIGQGSTFSFMLPIDSQ